MKLTFFIIKKGLFHFSLLTRVGSEILRDPITYEKVYEFISPLRERGDFVVIANEQVGGGN